MLDKGKERWWLSVGGHDCSEKFLVWFVDGRVVNVEVGLGD